MSDNTQYLPSHVSLLDIDAINASFQSSMRSAYSQLHQQQMNLEQQNAGNGENQSNVVRIMGVDIACLPSSSSDLSKDINFASFSRSSTETFSNPLGRLDVQKPDWLENQFGRGPFVLTRSEEMREKSRIRLSAEQSSILEEAFEENSMLTAAKKEELAIEVGIQRRQVEIWFQNRRARCKLKKAQKNYDSLVRLRERLQDRNKALREEIEKLKRLKASSESSSSDLPLLTDGDGNSKLLVSPQP